MKVFEHVYIACMCYVKHFKISLILQPDTTVVIVVIIFEINPKMNVEVTR